MNKSSECEATPRYEIERKFLVDNDSYKKLAIKQINIKQGYLSKRKESTVRVRIADTTAFLTVKGITTGCVREEYEYPIPLNDAERMMMMCEGKILSKTRRIVEYGGYKWEIDEFHGELAGLTLAEIELRDKDSNFNVPTFIGEEVTGNPKYLNSNLLG